MDRTNGLVQPGCCLPSRWSLKPTLGAMARGRRETYEAQSFRRQPNLHVQAPEVRYQAKWTTFHDHPTTLHPTECATKHATFLFVLFATSSRKSFHNDIHTP